MEDTLIIGAARTPIGSFLGELNRVPAYELGSIVIKAAIERSGIQCGQINEVLMGCVLSSGQGQAPARRAAIGAGISNNVGAITLNKVCGSGMRTVMLADSMIKAGHADIIVAGGMESMSMTPYALPSMRTGMRIGSSTVLDLMVHDGLWDPYCDKHMGSLADLCSEKYRISRKEQDSFAKRSYERAIMATEKGFFKDEIVPVEIKGKKGQIRVVDEDEEPKRFNWEKMQKLPPSFNRKGTVTAGNASSINDGAAALVLISGRKAAKLGVKPLARIVGHSIFAHDPKWFTIASAYSMKMVLEKTRLNIDQIDLFEINEAFSVQILAVVKELGDIDWNKINIHGGAVALGHPIGCSGARILVTLIYAMIRQQAKFGLATLCIGGGESLAMIIER